MADGVSISFDVKAIERRLKKIGENVEESLAIAAEETVAISVAALVEFSPTPEEEYDAIMRGNNNLDLVPLSGDTSGDSDGRTRFVRAPGRWIRELIPEHIEVIRIPGRITIGLGNLLAFIEGTRFSWVNKDGSERTLNEGWFELLEFGGSITVNATNAQRLSPDENRSHRTRSITKYFPGFRTFTKLSPATVTEAVKRRLRL